MKTITSALIVTLAATAVSAFVVSHAARNDPAAKMTRARALAGLRECSKRPRGVECSETAADFLIDLYWRGDVRVLKALLDAQPHSDAALSESLGTFYSRMLVKQPRVFLRAIVGRPSKERRDLCSLAGGTDGSGMSDVTLRAVRANLRRISLSRGSRLAPVARACWAEASAADRHAKNQGR